jgi:hypothetical protein
VSGDSRDRAFFGDGLPLMFQPAVTETSFEAFYGTLFRNRQGTATGKFNALTPNLVEPNAASQHVSDSSIHKLLERSEAVERLERFERPFMANSAAFFPAISPKTAQRVSDEPPG